jgi:hypothetical protein
MKTDNPKPAEVLCVFLNSTIFNVLYTSFCDGNRPLTRHYIAGRATDIIFERYEQLDVIIWNDEFKRFEIKP